MNLLRSLALAGAFAVAAPCAMTAQEREHNAWPFVVRQTDSAGRTESWTAAGPLFFHKSAGDGGTVGGLRPLWVETHDAQRDFRSGFFVYPLFSYRTDENTYSWNALELVRRTERRADAAPPRSAFESGGDFEVWPFWFSRQTGDPELSYRALFPAYGTIKNKLGTDRASWVLFPLYAQTEKRGAVTTAAPWPFIRVTRGAAHGWGVWPLFSDVERPGVSREEYYLWPLGYDATREPTPDDPPGTPPRRDVGFLPFYARSTGPGYASESFLWPFFGYTDQQRDAQGDPRVYHETRYLWPLLVQGRGENKCVNRWGPFYTHSVARGYEKTWYAWPLLRRAQWAEENLVHTKTQLLYFFYWSHTERSATRPEAPAAELTHVWPLYSTWSNGSGRSQWQLFSPLDVFFPQLDPIKNTWTPLFAIARHEQRAPGDTRTSLLWDAITWSRREAENHREFHLGPLFSEVTDGGTQRLAIGNGLFGWKRTAAGGGWRMFWLDFPAKATTTEPRSR